MPSPLVDVEAPPFFPAVTVRPEPNSLGCVAGSANLPLIGQTRVIGDLRDSWRAGHSFRVARHALVPIGVIGGD
jgi:hypothetical protein